MGGQGTQIILFPCEVPDTFIASWTNFKQQLN